MRIARSWTLLLVGCGSHAVVGSQTASLGDGASAAPPSAACGAARELRSKAVALEHDGHELLARSKLDAADAECPTEKAASADLDKRIAASLSNDAPPKGTDATMRSKMHDAYDAERARDFPKARTLYLEAWAEHHPMPRALEDAGRMAALGGDAAESRRLRDRALAEAEATEKGVAEVSARIHASTGAARMYGTTLVLDQDGTVVTRDSATGEVRVRVVANEKKGVALSPLGTYAFGGINAYDSDTLSVYDVLTGALAFKVPHVKRFVVSPDDKVLVVRNGGTPNDAGDMPSGARVYDLMTGEMKSKLATDHWTGNELVGFAPDASHLLVVYDEGSTGGGVAGMGIRQWDLAKGAYTSLRLQAEYGVASTSLDGHYLVYLEERADNVPVHVRDMTNGTEVAQWKGSFHSLETVDVSPDAKWVATGSFNSLRLWDVAQKKQTFKRAGTDFYDVPATNPFTFSDDSKAMIVAGYKPATRWDVATGTETPLAADPAPKNVLRVVKAPDGVAVVLEDEVRLLPHAGDPRTVCTGLPQPVWAHPTMIGPTSVAFSPSGKLFACAMWDGWVHVLETTGWTEKAVIKRGAGSPIDRPVDLVFSADETTLTDVSDSGFVVYDAQTGKETRRVQLRHGGQGFAPRHARFDDGTIAVRAWNGTAAIFAADGTWQHDVKLVANVPSGALDAFASNGKTYAVVLGKTLHVVDLANGDDKTTDLPAASKSIAVSPDGQTVLAAGADGVITAVTAGAAAPYGHAKGIRVGFAGKTVLVWTAPSSVDAYTAADAAPVTLEFDGGGVVARGSAGAFETRGKPEVVCVVGSTYLSRITCDDRSQEGLVASWIDRTK